MIRGLMDHWVDHWLNRQLETNIDNHMNMRIIFQTYYINILSHPLFSFLLLTFFPTFFNQDKVFDLYYYCSFKKLETKAKI